MECRAAVIRGVDRDATHEEIEVDPPKAGEAPVGWMHALRFDIPNLLSTHRAGAPELDELITDRCPRPDSDDIDDIDMGYRALRDGENIRGAMEHAS